MKRRKKVEISIIIPVYNEEKNITLLAKEIGQVYHKDFPRKEIEVIWIDDGSTDKTLDKLKRIKKRYKYTRIIELRRNFGQTAALMAGFDHAEGEIIVTMDGDLQNDPKDIKKLVDKLDKGYDMVVGWRKDRKDKLISRKIPSFFANLLIRKLFATNIHDRGCSLKAFRKDLVEQINLYGDLHRFIPEVASAIGCKMSECKVNHRKRQNGKSKYGISRTIKVLLDLINLKFILQNKLTPIQFFGGMGMSSIVIGFVLLTITLLLKILIQFDITGNPLLIISVLFIFVGIQLVSIGLLGELVIRMGREEDSKRKIYKIRNII